MYQHAFRSDFFTEEEKKESEMDLRNPAVKSILADLAASVRAEKKADPWRGQNSQLPSIADLIEVRNAHLTLNKNLGRYTLYSPFLPPSLSPYLCVSLPTCACVFYYYC
jgi:hypothetical protein